MGIRQLYLGAKSKSRCAGNRVTQLGIWKTLADFEHKVGR